MQNGELDSRRLPNRPRLKKMRFASTHGIPTSLNFIASQKMIRTALLLEGRTPLRDQRGLETTEGSFECLFNAAVLSNQPSGNNDECRNCPKVSADPENSRRDLLIMERLGCAKHFDVH